MKILFLIALISFAALVWASVAITRHIRKTKQGATDAMPDPEMSEAIDLRLNDLARTPIRNPVPLPANGAHDFAYFNKEAPERPRSSTPERQRTTVERP